MRHVFVMYQFEQSKKLIIFTKNLREHVSTWVFTQDPIFRYSHTEEAF